MATKRAHALRFGFRMFCACFVSGLLVFASSEQKKKTSGDPAKGKEVFEQCSMCHASETNDKRIGPSLKGLYKRSKLTNGKPLNDANVMEWINTGGSGMPGFADMLSPEEKANLLGYLHTL